MLISLLAFSLLFQEIATEPAASRPPAPSLEALLSEEEFREYTRAPRYRDRMDVYRESLSAQADQLKAHLEERQLKPAQAVLARIQSLARYALEEPARKSASAKDLRAGEVRKLEIRIRKLVDALDDFKHSVPFDYREDFESTIEALERLRDSLLKQLFEL
jgi:hypothetical protein